MAESTTSLTGLAHAKDTPSPRGIGYVRVVEIGGRQVLVWCRFPPDVVTRSSADVQKGEVTR